MKTAVINLIVLGIVSALSLAAATTTKQTSPQNPSPTGTQCHSSTVPGSNVTVTVSGTDLVEFNSSVSLSCSTSKISPSFLWLNGSSVLTVSGRVQLSDQNRTVTIANVSRYDQGPFTCRASNAVSSESSKAGNLSISYGPEQTRLETSPSLGLYEKGSNISFSCSAVSSPAAQFTWLLDSTQLPDTGPELRLTNIQTSQSGNYSCQAFNSKTLRYQTSQPSAVTVVEPEPQSASGCSGGCIAGIVITFVVVVVLYFLLLYYLHIKAKKNKPSSNREASTRIEAGGGQDNATFPQNQELYSNISYQNKEGGTVQLGPESNTTQYAEYHEYRPHAPSSVPTYDAIMDQMTGEASQSGPNGADGAQELHYSNMCFQSKEGGNVQLGPESNTTQYAEYHEYRPHPPSSAPTYDAIMDQMTGEASQSGPNGADGAQVHEN